MSRQAVYSDLATGSGDRVWLDQLGIVTGLKYSNVYPGGDNDASWSLMVPENFWHRALAPGRTIGICNGGSLIWQGILQIPTPGTPWTCQANGLGTLGQNYRAYEPSSNNAYSINGAVDAAIGRGLPWTRNSSIPIEASTNAPSASETIEEALNDVTDRNNEYWQVSTLGALTVAAAPTTISHLLYATDTAAGRALTSYISALFVHFIDISTNAQTTVYCQNSNASNKFGTIEDDLDMTGASPMSISEATDFGNFYIGKSSPRTYFAGSFTATYGQLCVLGGQPKDLATAKAGSLLRVQYAAPNPDGEIFPGATADLLVGNVDYDSDADTLSITPVNPPTTTYQQQRITDLALIQYNRFKPKLAAAEAAKQRQLAAAKAAAQKRHAAWRHSLKTQAHDRAVIAARKKKHHR